MDTAACQDEGVPRESAVRCDFLMLMFKSKLTGYVSSLPGSKRQQLRRALARPCNWTDATTRLGSFHRHCWAVPVTYRRSQAPNGSTSLIARTTLSSTLGKDTSAGPNSLPT